VDDLCWKVPLLVLHDFDKAGFSILATLQRTTRRYSFRNSVKVKDLGLRLADVEAHGLEAEDVGYDSNPTYNLRENGATPEEIAFLYDGSGGGQRVELNAFASDELIAWIEEKLEEHGIKKMVPDEADLTVAYRRALHVALVRTHISEIEEKAKNAAEEAEIPDGLADTIRERLDADREIPWDAAMAAVAEEAVENEEIILPDD
jgi:hypothetical protein